MTMTLPEGKLSTLSQYSGRLMFKQSVKWMYHRIGNELVQCVRVAPIYLSQNHSLYRSLPVRDILSMNSVPNIKITKSYVPFRANAAPYFVSMT